MDIVDSVGAFIDFPVEHRPGPGPLGGLTLAVKDLFDVAGFPTGGGHPLRRETSLIKQANAAVVDRLLTAGARFIGKTHTDEFAYSMNGENPHYGTPANPRAPGRIPGGSSSGSAAAVAAGLADIALGTDTGGSIRLPAAYCGLIGLRPTYGAIDMSGLQPLARSFDTIGWFARDLPTYRLVADLLLPPISTPPVTRIAYVTDIAEEVVGPAERDEAERCFRLVSRSLEVLPPIRIAPDGFAPWRQVFRTVQAYDAWADHGEWIQNHRPQLGHGVRERFEWAAAVTAADYAQAQRRRRDIAAHLHAFVPPGTVLAFPTVPSIAPLPGVSGEELERYRSRSISMLCSAGLAGLPQLSLPIGEVAGMPFGFSIMGWPGSDLRLLEFADGPVLGGPPMR